jgi:hypothetical protein
VPVNPNGCGNGTPGSPANASTGGGGGGGGGVCYFSIAGGQGAGGGGSGSCGNSGSAGNPGSAGTPSTFNAVPVSPGTNYSITVGSGGQANISWNPQ